MKEGLANKPKELSGFNTDPAHTVTDLEELKKMTKPDTQDLAWNAAAAARRRGEPHLSIVQDSEK